MKKALPSAGVPKRTILLLLAVSVLLIAACLSLSFLQFSSQLYIKRSPNTFVGDEKYRTVRAEVEQELESMRS